MEAKKITSNYKHYKSMSELPTAYAQLIEASKEAVLGSHAPYSNFNVGAALLLADGQIIRGSNQENAAYPLGFCAERTAISAAVALAPKIAIKAIAIVAKKVEQFIENPVAPCGICRQVLLETEFKFENNITLILYGANNAIYVFDSIKEIMPLYFNHEAL